MKDNRNVLGVGRFSCYLGEPANDLPYNYLHGVEWTRVSE